MDPITRQAIAAAGGAAAAGDPLYVDDVFSTFLYEGTGSAQTITNGIDLSGEGGLVWFKNRGVANHGLVDTERTRSSVLFSNATASSHTSGSTGDLTSFNSDGFSIGTNFQISLNSNGDDICSWTFRKAPGFFDIVTYTGNGVQGRTISHNLGSTPGMIIVKRTDSSRYWAVYHRSLGATKYLRLNETNAESTSNQIWSNTEPTSSVFTVHDNATVNISGASYVAYLFAHDDQSFGTNSDEAIIKCGTYTGNGSSSGPVIDLGFEPQWLLIKSATGSNADGIGWYLFDSMRGIGAPGVNDKFLSPNTTGAESTGSRVGVTSTGFTLTTSSGIVNGNSTGYIYMAIRRPHKPPTAGTEVFQNLNYDGTSAVATRSTNILVDALITQRTNSGAPYFLDRVRGFPQYIAIDAAYSEGTQTTNITTAANNFLKMGSGATVNYSGKNYLLSMFKRAPGFFDVVAYTGTGSTQNISHNLESAPEMIICKARDVGFSWTIYNSSSGATKRLRFNNILASTSSTSWNNTAPTSSVFTVGSDANTNNSSTNYIAYLFATLDGISKVGSYSGTGYDINVDCGFTAGARWIMIKRTDSTGDWYIFNTVRGITSGNDPYMLLNDYAAEVTNTDYIDPLNAGFTVTSSAPAALNASGGTYLFLAIA